MPLQNLEINFAHGLDTKTDPWQVPAGKFLSLQNSVFDKGGMLQKRNGYAQLTSLPGSAATYLTTINGNLTAIASSIEAYSSSTSQWVSKGTIQPMGVATLPLIRNSIDQIQCDSVVATNGLVCVVYSQNNNGTTVYRYAILNSVTGQNIVAPTAIPVAAGVVTGSPRVFILGNYFVIIFTNVISAVSHLQYISVSINNPTVVTANQDIAASYVAHSTVSWDAVNAGNNLYIAYNTTSGGQSVDVTFLTVANVALGQTPASPHVFSGSIATLMTMATDNTNPQFPVIYISFYDLASTTGFTAAVDINLNVVLGPTEIIASGTVLNMASVAFSGMTVVYYEIANNYSYDSSIPTHILNFVTCTALGVVVGPQNDLRSVGLASKAVLIGTQIFFLASYQSPYQSTYFLIGANTTDFITLKVVGKLAYENGGGYLTLGLPSITVTNNVMQFPYLIRDFIAAESAPTSAPVAGEILGVYSQTGINMATMTIGTKNIDTAEIAANLHISGGFLWQYDGYLPVEHNFFLYPDSIEVTTATGSGSIAAGTYFYAATYEWEDNQGNVYRSATSIPVSQVTTTASSTNTINVPYLRLTYKLSNPAKIVIYRWSVAQPVFYRITSLTAVQLNVTTSDSLAFVDTLADASILGNDILYTTGGAVEDINAPASELLTLFDDRLWLVDAEDPNLLWYSKQVIEATPVEMSDLLTYYVPPSQAAQGSTGPITAIAPMDDKLIIFKQNALYYINGTGPDNTGSNNQYSPSPIFITSTVGSDNQQSIVFVSACRVWTPDGEIMTSGGLIFQSGKGLWLLSRDLATYYIGAPVQVFNQSIVQSAVNVPETNQVRFTLNTGQTLMFDYYYGEWGTFVNVPAISSCIYQNLHTFLNSSGQVYQESPGIYVDGSNPVLLSFTTSWLNLAGVQGYQRAFFFFMLGQYLSPHKLYVQVAYDYNPGDSSAVVISPTNFSPVYGGNGMGAGIPALLPGGLPNPQYVPSTDNNNLYGQQNHYGGPSAVEDWRVFFKRQRCQSFQITLTEVFDPSHGVQPGAGLTLSGLNLVVAVKRGFRTIRANNSAGAS